MSNSYEFPPFRLEPATRRLSRLGEPLDVTPKAFDVLQILVENRDRVMERQELLRLAWPDTNVEQANLSQSIFTLRRVLGDRPDGARYIATVPKRGYRFVAEVRVIPNGDGVRERPDREPPSTARSRRSRVTLLGLTLLALPVLGYLVGRRAALSNRRRP